MALAFPAELGILFSGKALAITVVLHTFKTVIHTSTCDDDHNRLIIVVSTAECKIYITQNSPAGMTDLGVRAMHSPRKETVQMIVPRMVWTRHGLIGCVPTL